MSKQVCSRHHTDDFKPQSSKTWYGGSWSRGYKATPVTQVAKESISAASGAATDIVASARSHTPQLSATPIRSPAVYLSRNMASSSRSLPLAATTTKLNITSNSPKAANGAAQEGQPAKSEHTSEEQSLHETSAAYIVGDKIESSVSEIKGPTDKGLVIEGRNESSHETKSNRDSTSWINWFTKVDKSHSKNGDPVNSKQTTSSEQTKDKNSEFPQVATSPASEHAQPPSKHRRNSDPSPTALKSKEEATSWLGLWGNTTTQTQNSKSAHAAKMVASTGLENPTKGLSKNDRLGPAQAVSIATPRPPSQSTDSPKSYGWAFWSKDESQEGDAQKKSSNGVGELAQTDSPTQSRPENAMINSRRGVPEKVGKRERPQSLGTLDDLQKSKTADDIQESVANKKSAAEASLKAKRMPENLVLPLFKRTYDCPGRPTFVQQLSRLLQIGQSSESKHVSIAQSPHRVNKALAIGVHGYFPAPLIRSVLGQPTGTSIRFANSAASAIHKWTQKQGYTCEIEKVALEGEGKIAERVELLWKLMLNWIEKIRKADFVMIACHSQGVPVAMMLVAKLIAFGCVNSAKIGVCAMAGVNLGPFADYKSRWISGSAGELFEFAHPESQVSKDYKEALDVALRFGVKVVYIGSIDDQLVSLDVSLHDQVVSNNADRVFQSSTFGTVNHPYIYRAVFVDGRVHAPDFLTHLVGFALKLRNLGISDHGLIRELSTPLAGSLYGGEGHSRIYDDEAVYYLAVEYVLETTSLGNIPMHSHRENQATPQNPYILPFAMRGLLEEDYVRTELYGEITELIKQFDDWKPTSKVLKDVKFRLEGVRSKL